MVLSGRADGISWEGYCRGRRWRWAFLINIDMAAVVLPLSPVSSHYPSLFPDGHPRATPVSHAPQHLSDHLACLSAPVVSVLL